MGALRLILALSVVCVHEGNLPLIHQLVGGQLAVQSFYIISGFYMALVLQEKYTSTVQFYKFRLLKIYSIYWTALVIEEIIFPAFAGKKIFPGIRGILESSLNTDAKLLMLTAVVLIFGSDLMMFSFPSTHGISLTSNFYLHQQSFHALHPFPQMWSIPVEMFFYLLIPVLIRRKNLKIFATLTSLTIYFATIVIFGYQDPWTHRFGLSQLWVFMLGVMAYQVFRRQKRGLLFRIRNRNKLLIEFSIIGLLVLMVEISNYAFAHNFIYARPFNVQTRDMIYILSVAACLPLLFETSKKSKIDKRIGEISYGIYIFHIFIGQIFSSLHHPLGNFFSLFIFLTSALASFFTEKYVYYPTKKYLMAKGKKK